LIPNPSKTKILLKKRTPETIKTKPRSFYSEKTSWPKPGLKRKNNHITSTLLYSIIARLVAVEYLVMLTPQPLNIVQKARNANAYRYNMGSALNYFKAMNTSSACPLIH
jgi:hypothetical protein